MSEIISTARARFQCRHIHADGRRCGSPALRAEDFCYFHHSSRKPTSKPLRRHSRRSAFDLPLPEDRTAIQLSIGEVLRRIASNDVDPRRAGLLLYGLQIASANLPHPRHPAPEPAPVDEFLLDPALGPLAPPAELPSTSSNNDTRPSLISEFLRELRGENDPPSHTAPLDPAPEASADTPSPCTVILPVITASIRKPSRTRAAIAPPLPQQVPLPSTSNTPIQELPPMLTLRRLLLVLSTLLLATPRLPAQAAANSTQAAVDPIQAAASRLPLFPRFQNPLTLTDRATGPGVSCPDPAIASETDRNTRVWYLYCTGDPLNSNDVDASGNLRNHYIAIWRSIDLIHFTYIGDAFPSVPSWIGVETNLWAPAVRFFNGKFYLYYVAPETGAPGGPSEIGVATSDHAGGPWKDLGRPVVATEASPCCANTNRAVIDPDVVTDSAGQRYISFGSFFGGISIQKLSRDGFTADKSSEVQLAVDNLYEGGSFFKHDGWFYLFVSSTDCCNGPLSGYSVDVGRARSPLGPFLDRNGVPLTSTSGGGTKVIAANGNRWIGPGGNVLFTDASGQDYMLYHAIDQTSPFFSGNPGFTRRPALIDPVQWTDGWPSVRNGHWASAGPVPGPVAQPWQISNRYLDPLPNAEPGEPIPALSDDFNTDTLSPRWHFIHPQADNTFTLTGSAYQVQSHGPDENGSPAVVSILGEPVPSTGDWMVETKATVSLPFDGSCCYNFAQGALFIYGDDNNSIKLDVFADFDTRQTEFGKQISPVPANYPTYGNAFVGTAAPTTWLRIVKHSTASGGERYTAYTSTDGYAWTRGSTWLHHLGPNAQIGLSAQNAEGITVSFDYVHVTRLR